MKILRMNDIYLNEVLSVRGYGTKLNFAKFEVNAFYCKFFDLFSSQQHIIKMLTGGSKLSNKTHLINK